MSLEEVEKLFGKPNSTYSTFCGLEGAQWQCEILIYLMRDKHGDYRGDNKLYLNMRDNPPTLDHWDLKYVY
jgi:hypothetical protein